jgi:hypothetical protein
VSSSQTSRACLAVPPFSRVSQLPADPIAHDHERSSLQARKDAVMDRPIPRYIDYLIAVSAESITLPPQPERDLLLLHAIRLQSFGPTRAVMLGCTRGSNEALLKSRRRFYAIRANDRLDYEDGRFAKADKRGHVCKDHRHASSPSDDAS